MYYRLSDNYALRAWKFVNHMAYRRFTSDPIPLDDETFELLMQCDGEHDLKTNDRLNSLTGQGVIAPCPKGTPLSGWSRFRKYEHRFVPAMNLMITGKCNYNCRHCFNAAENAERMAEWDYDALLDLFDRMADCGFHSVTLTGGEPMLHPHFKDIVRAIYDRNMVLDKLTTNGFFLDQDTLDFFRELHAEPGIKISFDGVGHHDWMRGHSGAEEDAKRALRLCVENGFCTLVQTQVHRGNIDVIPETLQMLDDLGVNSTRIIRTTPVPRWVKNAPDGSLPTEEYFERMLDLAEGYMDGEHKMKVNIWRFLNLYPEIKSYNMLLDQRPDGHYQPTAHVCEGNRRMMAVTCEGNVVPCLQMSDYVAHLGETFDSLKERPLEDILREGKWLDAVCMNHYHLRERNRQCDTCEWFEHCGGGCRALGILDAGEKTGKLDYCASDPLACLFFKGGWYARVQERLHKYARV
ncbi:MAG: radical SAM protein [Lachnospiraceae bacterium]|nr:radical SAM protein [Lachnospiraceae bacterium]